MKQAEFQTPPTKVLPVPVVSRIAPEHQASVRAAMAKVADELVANLNRNVLKKK